LRLLQIILLHAGFVHGHRRDERVERGRVANAQRAQNALRAKLRGGGGGGGGVGGVSRVARARLRVGERARRRRVHQEKTRLRRDLQKLGVRGVAQTLNERVLLGVGDGGVRVWIRLGT
jgi:hypothetical protein